MAKTKQKTLSCEFGGFSGKGEKIRIGVDISRSVLSHDEADELFCGSQLQCTMISDPQGKSDADGQKTMLDTSDGKVEAVAESRRVSYDSTKYHISLLIPDGDIDAGAVKSLTGKSGKIKVARVGDASSKTEDGEEAEA